MTDIAYFRKPSHMHRVEKSDYGFLICPVKDGDEASLRAFQDVVKQVEDSYKYGALEGWEVKTHYDSDGGLPGFVNMVAFFSAQE